MRNRDLARRAVSCKAWRWVAGMAYTDHSGVLWRIPESGRLMALESECLPVLQESATKGCLLELVREAWGDPSMTTHMVMRNQSTMWRVGRIGILPTLGEYRTELEALVSALEQAPALKEKRR